MKPSIICIAIALTVFTAASALAGGGACRFATEGLPLLKQSPALAEILTTKFSVEDSGKMGPMDAPFDGGRLYTYMEFRASPVGNPEQKFIIRLHFKRKDAGLRFASAEILPVKDEPTAKEAGSPS